MPIWSTEGLPERAQFGFWREVICEAFAALDPHSTAGSAAFPSTVTLSTIGPVNAARILSCPQIVRRGRREIRIDPQDRLFVNLQIAGTGRVVQGDRRTTVPAGSFVLVDTARPYQLEFEGPFQLISFRIPRHDLLPLAHHGDALFARAIAGDRGGVRVAAAFMRTLMDEAEALSGPERSAFAAQLCQLVAAAAAADADPADRGARLRGGFRDLAIGYLESRLGDPGLSAGELTVRFGVSERYVQKVFAEAGTTVVAQIRSLRLAQCARALANPRDRRSISAIAASSGFGDIPHFTRVFMRRYGLSPGAWRRRIR